MKNSDDYARLVETSPHGEARIAYALLAIAATIREEAENDRIEARQVRSRASQARAGI